MMRVSSQVRTSRSMVACIWVEGCWAASGVVTSCICSTFNRSSNACQYSIWAKTPGATSVSNQRVSAISSWLSGSTFANCLTRTNGPASDSACAYVVRQITEICVSIWRMRPADGDICRTVARPGRWRASLVVPCVRADRRAAGAEAVGIMNPP